MQGDKSGDWSKAVCKGCFSGLRSPACSVLFWMFSFKYLSTHSSWQSLTERWIYNLKPYVVWKKSGNCLQLERDPAHITINDHPHKTQVSLKQRLMFSLCTSLECVGKSQTKGARGHDGTSDNFFVLLAPFQASPNCFSILWLGRPDNQKA